MKKQHLLLSLMAVLFSLLGVQDMMAARETRQDALYIFRNDGQFDFFFYGDIDRICYSKIDTLGIEQLDYVVQEVWALDTVYRIPLTAIDSVAFVTPETKVWPDVFCPDDRIADYIIDGDSIWWIRLAHNTPADLLPTVGGKMLIDSGVSPFIPDGFGGRVAVVEHEEDGWLIATEPTPITEIFERLVAKAAGATPGAQSHHRVPRRSLSGDEYGVPEMTFDLLSFEKEFTLANSGISSPDNDYFSISADLTGTWKPKCDVDLTLRACLFVDVPSLSFKFDEKSIWWYKYENTLSLEGSLSSRFDLPLIKKEKNIDGLTVELSAGPYIEGSISGYKISSTHKKEQAIGMTAVLTSSDFRVEHGGMIVADPTVKTSSKVYQDTTEYEGYLPLNEEGAIQPPNTMSLGVGLGFKAGTKLAMPLEKAKKVLPEFLLKYMQKHALNKEQDTIGFKCEAGLDLGAKVDMKAPWHVFIWDNPPLLESESVFKQLDEDSEFTASLYWKYGVSLKLGPWTYSEPNGDEIKSRPRGLVPSISGVRVATDTEQNPIRPYVKRFFSPITRNLMYPVDIGFVVFDEDKEIVAKQCDLSWYNEDVFDQNLPFFKNGTYQFTMNIDPGKGEPVKYTAYPMVRLANGHELLVNEGDYDFEVEAAAFDIPQRVIAVGPQSGMIGGEYVGSIDVEVIPNMENVEVKTEETWLRNITWSGHLNELTFFWDDLPESMRSRRGVIRLMGLSQKGEELVEDSIVVVQSTAYVDVEPKKLTFPKEGGTQTVTITETSLTNITPTIVSENIHVSMTDNVITVTADENTDAASRYVWIYINGTTPDGRETSIPSIEVTQEGTGDNPSGGEVYNMNIGHLGGQFDYPVTATGLSNFNIENTNTSLIDAWYEDSDFWVNPYGHPDLRVWINENYLRQPRSGTVKLTATDASGATITLITLNVEQKAYPDGYKIKIKSIVVGVEVLTNRADDHSLTDWQGISMGIDGSSATLEGNVMHVSESFKYKTSYNADSIEYQCTFDVLDWDNIYNDGDLTIANINLFSRIYFLNDYMIKEYSGRLKGNGLFHVDEDYDDDSGWEKWYDDDGYVEPEVRSMQYIATEESGLNITDYTGSEIYDIYESDWSSDHKNYQYIYVPDPNNKIKITLSLEKEYIYNE